MSEDWTDDPDEEAAAETAALIHVNRKSLRSPDTCYCRNCDSSPPLISKLWVWRDGVTYLWFPGGKWNHGEVGWSSHPATAYPLRGDTRVMRTGECRKCRFSHMHIWDGRTIRVHELGHATRGVIT